MKKHHYIGAGVILLVGLVAGLALEAKTDFFYDHVLGHKKEQA